MSDKKYDVFLSYSFKDKDWVSEFVTALKNAGVKAWFDVADVVPGEKWQEKIQEALRESSTLIFIITPDSTESPWTFFELGAAVADKKKIIPVMPKDVDWTKIPSAIRQFQMLNEASPEIAGKKVADALGSIEGAEI